MKKRFFIPIGADFLLDNYDNFLPLTPWLYLHLRFKYNYFPNQSAESGITINTLQLAKEIGFAQSIVWASVDELNKKGLIAKLESKKYIIISEKKYIESISKNHVRLYDTKNAFFQISKDFFEKYWKFYEHYMELKLYYYLIMKNNHFLFHRKLDRQLLTGNGITLTNIWKELKIHRLTLNKYLERLENGGLIEYEGDIIYTLSESYILKKSN
jgi:Mn-dependent DtxR family transcriptional regulator